LTTQIFYRFRCHACLFTRQYLSQPDVPVVCPGCGAEKKADEALKHKKDYRQFVPARELADRRH
jgi:hypothetical protein